MLSINTNLSSLIVQSNLLNSTLGLNQAIERMTTGFKINGAKDNAAGYSISTSMSTKIGAYQVAEDNASMGLDMVSTASGTLEQISDRISRLRALTVQAQNGTYGSSSIDAIRQEADGITSEINRLMATAEYNGIKLFGENIQGPIINGEKVVLNEKGFMNEINPRDTSTMPAFKDVNLSQSITGGIYSISSPEELKKLLENPTRISGGEFVLAQDIDMSGVRIGRGAGQTTYSIVLDGNGHIISNLNDALFGILENSEIKNLGLENISVTEVFYSPVAVTANNTKFSNCWVTGVVTIANFGGTVGLVGNLGDNSSVENCWTDVNITNASISGGIAGMNGGNTVISNCFVLGDVTGNAAGGIIGNSSGSCIIENCYTEALVSSREGATITPSLGVIGGNINNVTINNVTYNEDINPKMELYNIDNSSAVITLNIAKISNVIHDITLQVGIGSDTSSQITFSTAFSISGLSSDIENPNLLTTLDEILESLSNKQTELGSVQNRLESVLDEISIQYDNLVSSRSTIRDADIAEESSQYIKMQILQQASATLLATANQTPAIALQLL